MTSATTNFCAVSLPITAKLLPDCRIERRQVPINTHHARLHNVLLGGKDGYEPDHHLAKLLPKRFKVAVRESRQFALRAVDCLVSDHAVRQVVELGCGFPWSPDIGEVAARANRSSRVLYIDNDRFVATFGRALLVRPNSAFADVDLTDTEALVDHIAAVMDMSAPIAVCMSGTAELLQEAPAVLDRLLRRLPAGCWLALSHITHDFDDVGDRAIDEAAEDLRIAGIGYYPRTRDDIAAMLDGCTLLTPGLVDVSQWRPEIAGQQRSTDESSALRAVPETVSAYAAVGRYLRS